MRHQCILTQMLKLTISRGNITHMYCFGEWPGSFIILHLSYDQAISLLGIYPTEMKTYVHTKFCTWMLIVACFITALNWKQPKCSSVGEQIKKLAYLYNEQLPSNKKETITNTHDINETQMYCWIRKAKFKGYILYDYNYMIFL